MPDPKRLQNRRADNASASQAFQLSNPSDPGQAAGRTITGRPEKTSPPGPTTRKALTSPNRYIRPPAAS
jgi:hypothetical protein